MRLAALILGILGGIVGILGGGAATLIGGVGQVLEAEGASTVVGLGMAAIPTAILGIVGGAMAMARPKAAGIMMLISAGAGVIFVSAAYYIAAIMLVAGGILALVGQKEIKALKDA